MNYPTEEEWDAAIVAALTAANAAPYDLDDAKALTTVPAFYTEVMVSRRFIGEGARSSGVLGVQSVRISTRAIGKTVSNAREVRKRVTSALEDVALTFTVPSGTYESTPIAFESEDLIGQDGTLWSGLTTWTAAI